MYYDWDKILKGKNDTELFKAVFDHTFPKERRLTAEKILLERNIIVKTADGTYVKEIIKSEFLEFAKGSLKSNSVDDTLSTLIDLGLDKESSIRLIEICLDWKKEQKRKLMIWVPVLILCLIIEIASEVAPSLNSFTTLIKFLYFLTIILFISQMSNSYDFSRTKIFKVLTPVKENENN